MEIRQIHPSEREKAVSLIWKTFLEFEAPDYSAKGTETFRTFIFDRGIFERVEFFGAFEDDGLKGVIATRNKRSHICCFFVLAQCQGQGMGKALWNYVKSDSTAPVITVNASPFAVPVYHKLGFSDTNTEQLKDGIRYTPMQFIR